MLHYEIDAYGAASTYAFTQMVRPEIGLSLKATKGRYFVQLSAKVAAPNKDLNGGWASVLSLKTGASLLRSRYVNTSLFAEFQHLGYGALFNDGVGGGALVTLHYGRVFATGEVAALWGFAGTVGQNLKVPGNDFIFSGELGYKANSHFSPYIFISQQRYVGGDNSLTAVSVGAGAKVFF